MPTTTHKSIFVIGSAAVREVSAILGFTDGDVWRPGIGDPTVMGWLTVVAYFVAAVLCWRQVTTAAWISGGRERKLFWGMATLMMVFLGFNKQLDLQTWLTLTGRRIAIAQGWYESRRVAQGIFVILIATAGFFGAIIMRKLVGRHPEVRLSVIGLILVITFVVIRAASFHHVDQLINFRFGGVRMNWVLELGAIGVVAAGAWNVGRTKDRERGNGGQWVTTQ